ncbi:MAG: hypothetical protein N2Z73_04640 [Endomicrobia bacterium]|nr:hypothetical protein [Endomicrobiia bacterium]
MKNFFIFLLLILFSCSTPESLLRQAIKDEQKQNYEAAEEKYLTIVVKHSLSKYVPEAKYRLGLIYKDIKKDYIQSRMWFSDIIVNHRDSEFYRLAEIGVLESPDYLGIIDENKVILGDIESSGKNMKMVTKFKKLEIDLYRCNCELYAGEKLVRKEDKFYLKTGKEIREYTSNPKMEKGLKYTLVFKLPVEIGNEWETQKENKPVSYTIVANRLSVKCKKIEFHDCIKIMESYKGETGIRYLYYAPNKGCIKITTSSLKNPRQEFPVLEFIE